jgi:UDP-N-acetylglucosamine 1-carboxyvinyltransferase
LKDVETMADVLRVLGARVAAGNRTLEIQTRELTCTEAPYDYVRKMRASVLLLGPLLARFGEARVSMPGGCAIGVRPIDQHLKAFQAMGAEIRLVDGYVEAKAPKLRGADCLFDLVTVTGTINAMMAASLAEGTSVLRNCAREPEVACVAEVLRRMGAAVEGDGTATIRVTGRPALGGFDLPLIPDRIEAGTYLVAGAITEGDLLLRGARAADLEAVLSKLRACGAEVNEDPVGLRVRARRPFDATRLLTEPHPGFPTDMQAQFMVLLALAEGTSVVTETIFENRFMHVAELVRMGADLTVQDSAVIVVGVPKLRGAPVMATDLRASASLVLAGLAAEGTTDVLRIYHLDRGYENMAGKLKAVGARVERMPQTQGGGSR